MIDRITVDKILDAAQIVDVVGDFVTLKRAGANYKGLCPFHDDRTPSFSVNPAKNLCKCFACGKGGGPVKFLMEHEQLSYRDALLWLARKYGIQVEEKQLSDEERESKTERDSLFIVNKWANQWFQQQMRETQEGRDIGLSYFRGRGFRDDIIERFQLGYAPATPRDVCTKAALKAGYQEKFLAGDVDDKGVAHGVGISIKRDNGTLYDRFAGRVIFPIFTLSGNVVGFGGRVLDARTKGVNVKYLNSPESIIYSKRRELYGLFQAKQAIVKEDCVYMVEGYTDVMAMAQSGVENVVASSGTALTHEQIYLLRRFTTNIVVLYDGDAAGIKASQRGIDMLLRDGMNVRLLLLPDGDDPDSFARKHQADEYQRYMKEHQVDFIKFKTDLLMEEAKGDPIKLSNLINNIVQSISVIPDEIKRSLYIQETARVMQMSEHLISDAVSKQVKKNIEEWKKEKERDEAAKRREGLRANATQHSHPEGMTQPSAGHTASSIAASGASLTGSGPSFPGSASSLTASGASLTGSDPSFPGSDAPLSPSDAPLPDTAILSGFPPSDFPSSDGPMPTDFPPTDAPPAVTDGMSGMSGMSSRQAGNALSSQAGAASSVSSHSDVSTLIVQCIVRHGDTIICNMEAEDGTSQPLTVIEYIYYALQQDNLAFTNPLHQHILELGLERVGEPSFHAERYFTNHPEPEVCDLACQLSTDREQLSKIHDRGVEEASLQHQYNMLMELTNHLLIDLKLSIVEARKNEVMLKLKDKAVLSDRSLYRPLMQHLQELKKVEADLAKACGDRVVTR